MDLVACYDSDDESGINKSKTPTKIQDTSKEVDVIEIDDSDTDTELNKTLEANPSESPNENPQRNSKTNGKGVPANEIECIDIDSDIEEEIVSKPKDAASSATPKESAEAGKSNSKKIDYLNLDGTESEEEEQAAEADVNQLLSSASVLNNVPCGPEKYVNSIQSLEDTSTHRNKAYFESSIPSSSFSLKEEDVSVIQSPEDISTHRNKADFESSTPSSSFSKKENDVSATQSLEDISTHRNKLDFETSTPCSSFSNKEKYNSNIHSLEDNSTHRNKSDFESSTPSSSFTSNFDSSSISDKKGPKYDSISSINEKSPSFTDTASTNKRFKRDSSTPGAASVSGTDLNENEECGLSSYMYRKDERIIGAFAKSVACRLPRQITRHLVSHVNSVTALQWCIPQYSHLLLSASADCTAKIWDMYCKNPIQTVKDSLGLKAAKWSLSGEQVMIGGFGKKARVFDVLSGREIVSYDIFNYVHSIEIHPYIEDLFLCGTRNAIFGFDLRVNSTLPIRTYLSKCEEVLDIAFLDENEFICSTNVVSHDSADRTIMVWDFSSGAIMSNQIFLERYTCPSLKVHPNDSSFIAQTNGDYIATFSSLKPYKIKDKRYMGHKVSGFGVECDISPDGKYIASGDANGDVYFYNYSNTNVITKLKVRPNMATNRLKWHPALNSTLATATWDGHIQIWK